MAASPSHRRQRGRRRGRWLLVIGIAVVVVGLVAAGTVLATRSPSPPASATAKAAVLPLDVLSTTPSAGASGVPASQTITVLVSTPLAPDTPMPTLAPPVAGTWSAMSPTELQFVASGPLVPGSQEVLTVPGGPTGLAGAHGQHLGAAVTVPFTVAQGSVLRLQQLLAQLGYLPLSFSPATEPTSPRQVADPQEGTFEWRWANQPATLTSLWAPGAPNVITRGAIMNFESQHSMTTDGQAGPQVWSDLLTEAGAGAADPQPYGYVVVSQSRPETATVYQNGAAVYSTPVNTGVPAAPTASGTFPVFTRYTVTTMRGTNPDGSKYVDPGIPWVSYFNGGDALHGFVRGGYGYPQSDGCVEMPISNAAVVYPMTPIGTLVTVT